MRLGRHDPLSVGGSPWRNGGICRLWGDSYLVVALLPEHPVYRGHPGVVLLSRILGSHLDLVDDLGVGNNHGFSMEARMNAELDRLGKVIHRGRGALDALKASRETKAASLAEAMDRRQAILATQVLIMATAKKVQNRLKGHLQDMVQSALDSVFPGSYDYKVEFVTSAGRTEVDMWLDKDGTRMELLSQTGGGVSDVVAWALRIACWVMGKTDNVILADEPFKCIRGRPRMLLGDLIYKLSHRLKLQIIMVVDVANTPIESDREITVAIKSRKSYIAKVVNA